MTLIRIEDHRIALDELAHYRPVLAGEAEEGFLTEIELASGNTFYVKTPAAEIDKVMEARLVGPIQKVPHQ